MKTYIIVLYIFSVLQKTIPITIIRIARPHRLYLGTIQISFNLNESHYYLISTKSMICHINTNFSPSQSVNMLPFHISLKHLKLIFYGLISSFFKYYFKTGTVCFLLSSHAFTLWNLTEISLVFYFEK